MTKNESPVTADSVKKNGPCALSRDTAQKTLTSGESRRCCLCMWLLGSSHTDIVSVHLDNFFFEIPFYLQSVLLHSANCVLVQFANKMGFQKKNLPIMWNVASSEISFSTKPFSSITSLSKFQDQDSCLYTRIQFPQTAGTTWLHYSCVVRLF
jgi:hypothetical protein